MKRERVQWFCKLAALGILYVLLLTLCISCSTTEAPTETDATATGSDADTHDSGAEIEGLPADGPPDGPTLSDSDCAASNGCLEHGLCATDGPWCRVASEADCTASRWCKAWILLTW